MPQQPIGVFSGGSVASGLAYADVCAIPMTFAGDYYGWAIPVVTHANYYVDFDFTTDWKDMDLRWSEPLYLKHYSTPNEEEQVLLRFPYIDYRYKYSVTNPAVGTSALAWYPGLVHDLVSVSDARYESSELDKYGVTAASDWGERQLLPTSLI